MEENALQITFISNYLNHHQIPLCNQLYSRFGDRFTFVATTSFNRKRLELGYKDMNKTHPYVLTTYDSSANLEKSKRLATASDVLILGSAADTYMDERLKTGKLTFRYGERFFKSGISLYTFPRVFLSAKKHLARYQKYSSLYFLCASAYTAADVNLFSNYKNRAYKWGYFPEIKEYDLSSLFEHKNPSTLLWVGRFLDWKHPEAPLLVAKRLKEDGLSFQLNLIGAGEMETHIKALINDYCLDECVTVLGSMPPEAVRKQMEESGIFMFTSDFNEGWGAVLNESMNSGCAVVASHAIGSAPFLIDDNKNGLLYKNGDIDDLYKKVKGLLESPSKQRELGINAYKALSEQWCAKNAVDRLTQLSECILSGNSRPNLFDSGVCSAAQILKNNWYK